MSYITAGSTVSNYVFNGGMRNPEYTGGDDVPKTLTVAGMPVEKLWTTEPSSAQSGGGDGHGRLEGMAIPAGLVVDPRRPVYNTKMESPELRHTDYNVVDEHLFDKLVDSVSSSTKRVGSRKTRKTHKK